MAFTKQQLQKFAHLIRIELNDDELEKMQISSIIDWIDKLQQIDTAGIDPMLSPVEHDLPMRDDVVTDGNIREQILKNAPDAERGYFTVPKVIDDD